jgi:hypothetical protein
MASYGSRINTTTPLKGSLRDRDTHAAVVFGPRPPGKAIFNLRFDDFELHTNRIGEWMSRSMGWVSDEAWISSTLGSQPLFSPGNTFCASTQERLLGA